MNRNEFLRAMAGASFGASLLRAQQPAPETVTYKMADGCEIKADIHGAAPGSRKPAVIWIHGGALIQGSRKPVSSPLHKGLLSRGYAIVSIDYRLAPETKLPGIVADIQDAWRWVYKEGPKQFGIDRDRIAVAGGSAGGYLTLMTGFCVKPAPRALVSYYGYGDITTPWYSEPDDFYRRQLLVTEHEARQSVGSKVISEPPERSQRGRFYLYCRQQGIWPNEVAGHNPHKEPRWFDRYCPVRNVSAKYPPTILIHGTADTDVPYSESKNMAAMLAGKGIMHEFITVEGAGHGLSGAKPEEVANAASRAVDFIASH